MKRVFVSLPMKGRSYEAIKDSQREIFKRFYENNAELGSMELIESCFADALDHTPLECLGRSLVLMGVADYVVFGDGYEGARGCRIEHECAREYGKTIYVEHGNKIEEEK